MKTLFLILLACLMQPAFGGCSSSGLFLELGVGMHDVSIDGPEYTTNNPLGIGELRYITCPMKRWPYAVGVASYGHTSSLEGFPSVFDSPSENGYGANVVSLRVQFNLSKLLR